MRYLEVGDKLFNVKRDGFNDFARYSFSEVVSLTKTLAVLKNGVRLVNQPRKSYIISDVGYPVSKNKGAHWHIVTIEAIRDAQVENAKIEAHDWFQEKEFSLKEIMFIHRKFKELEKHLE